MSTRILIVDDELRNVAITEELLEDFEVEVALTGREAMEKVTSFRPDIVLLDIMMPGMDGYEVCRRIKQERSAPSIKVVFVSGKAMIEDRLAGYRAGGDDYIPKPFDHAELLARIEVLRRLTSVEELCLERTRRLHRLAMEALTPSREVVDLARALLARRESLPRDATTQLETIAAQGASIVSRLEQTAAAAAGIDEASSPSLAGTSS